MVAWAFDRVFEWVFVCAAWVIGWVVVVVVGHVGEMKTAWMCGSVILLSLSLVKSLFVLGSEPVRVITVEVVQTARRKVCSGVVCHPGREVCVS